jgi:hypothetical protein
MKLSEVYNNAKAGTGFEHPNKVIDQSIPVKEASSLEKRERQLSDAMEIARSITKPIRYANTHTEIMVKLSSLADQVGLEVDESAENSVRRLANDLESAVYKLEDVFEEEHRRVANAIHDQETDY